MLRERIELSHPPYQNGVGNQPPELLVVDWGRGLALYTAPRAGAGRVAGSSHLQCGVNCEDGWQLVGLQLVARLLFGTGQF